jgi:bacterioferritin (cytochrome b1)
MSTSPESLVELLRQELSAVNQQFFHILALRELDQQETAARIAQVDNIDFPNAMKIIDYLVSTKTPFSLGGAEFSPGTDYPSILKSEQALEQRLMAAIENTETANAQEAQMVQSAMEPRGKYIKWLEERLNSVTGDDSKPQSVGQVTAGTVACLVSLAEQSMVHAFFHWHSGEFDAADDAWSTSGAAMMHLTELVRFKVVWEKLTMLTDISHYYVRKRRFRHPSSVARNRFLNFSKISAAIAPNCLIGILIPLIPPKVRIPPLSRVSS